MHWFTDYYVLSRTTTILSLDPVLEQDLPLRIGKLIRLKQQRLRPSLARDQLEFVLSQEVHEHEFDLMAGDRATWTCVPAHAELHLLLSNAGQLELLLVFRGRVAELIETETVESVWIRIEVWIEIDGIGGEEDVGSLRDLCSV